MGTVLATLLGALGHRGDFAANLVLHRSLTSRSLLLSRTSDVFAAIRNEGSETEKEWGVTVRFLLFSNKGNIS